MIVLGRSNVLVGAQKDGQVEWSVEVRTSAETPIALFAKGGGISCADCRWSQRRTSRFMSKAEALTGSKVSGAGNDVIVASGSAISLEGTQVEAPKGSPLRMVGATKVAIVSSRLSGHESTVISGSALQLRIVDSEIATHQSYGFYFEGGGEIEIEESRMNGGGAGLVAKLGPSACGSGSKRSPEWDLSRTPGGRHQQVTLDDVRAGAAAGALRNRRRPCHGKNSVIASGGATFRQSAMQRLTLEIRHCSRAGPVIVSLADGRIDLIDS